MGPQLLLLEHVLLLQWQEPQGHQARVLQEQQVQQLQQEQPVEQVLQLQQALLRMTQ